MAERRMFAKTIIDSDAFLDMPASTQNLYFHLSMRADDDGFINNPRKIQRMIGASDDDLKILAGKNFLIPFESGVVVIKHWRIHNFIRNDRYKPTVYNDEKSQIEVKPNGAYTKKQAGIPDDNQPDTQMETQVRLGKVRLGKDNIDRPSLEEVEAYILSKQLVIIPQDFIEWYENTGWKDRDGKPIKNWKNKLLNWNKRELEKRPGAKPYSKPVEQTGKKCSCGGEIVYGVCQSCGKLFDGMGKEL